MPDNHRGEDELRAICERFEAANEDLSTVLDPGIWIQFTADASSYIWMNLVFLPAAKVSLDDIKAAWPTIAEWQRRLKEQQGPWALAGVNQFFALLDEESKTGSTLRDLANWCNFQVAQLAYRHLRTGNTEPLQLAENILAALGIPESEAKEWLDDIRANLEADRDPFTANEGPITRDHVKNRLRHWREKLPKGGAKTG